MIALYQFYLDGVLLVNEPKGWGELVTNIQRQTDIKGIFQTQDVTLTFTGDGYDILRTKFNTNFCLQTDIEIWEYRDTEYVLMFSGIIFVSACKVYDNECIIESTVEDNSFFAKIYNNKSIEAYVQVGTSKNLVSYTGAVTETFQTFNVCTTFWNAQDREGVTPFEAFRSLIAFMTDDTVDFESSLFDVGGEWNTDTKRLLITTGIKVGSTDPLVYGNGDKLINKFSFLTLFQEMDKNCNIGLMVDTTGARPKIIIESNSFFYNDDRLMLLDNVNGLKIYVDEEKLYGKVRFGSTTTLPGSVCPDPVFPESQEFLSFRDEEYYVLGQCNIDSELNLVRNWIVSSNIIQSITPPLTETIYDENIILIVCEKVGGVQRAIQGNPFSLLLATPRFFNEDLLNHKVAARYLGGVPNSIAVSLNNVTDECEVGRVGLNYPGVGTPLRVSTAFTSTYSPVDYNDKTTPPFFDTNNRFTLATDRYTCGAASGGLYAIQVEQVVNVSAYIQETPFNTDATQHHYINFQFKINHFDSLLNPLATYNFHPLRIYSYQPFNPTPLFGDSTLITQSPLFVMEAGDFITVSLIMDVIKVGTIFRGDFFINLLDGVFRTAFTSKGGGDLQAYDPTDYPVYKYEFSYPISPTDFDLIKNNPHKSIGINKDGVNTTDCYIDQAKYNHKTGICDFTLIRTV